LGAGGEGIRDVDDGGEKVEEARKLQATAAVTRKRKKRRVQNSGEGKKKKTTSRERRRSLGPRKAIEREKEIRLIITKGGGKV